MMQLSCIGNAAIPFHPYMEEPSPSWRIKILMVCLRIIPWDESQTVSNNPTQPTNRFPPNSSNKSISDSIA